MPDIFNVPIEEDHFPGDLNLDKKKLIRNPGWKKVTYRVKLDKRVPADRATFRRLLRDGAIDVMGFQWEILEGFIPGMKEKGAQDAFEAWKEAMKQKVRAVKAAEDAQLAFHVTDANVQNNSDPEQFKVLNKERIKASNELESSELFKDTVERHVKQKRSDFFTSLEDFQKQEVSNMLAQIEPVSEKYTEGARALAAMWKKEGVPLLQKLADLDQRYPNIIYFEQLSMGDLQLRSLKTLSGYSVIHYDKLNRRFAFKFEVVE